MSAAAITLGLNLAATYLPDIIVLIKHIVQKDGSVVTVATVVSKLDASAAAFADNLNADAAWFKANNLSETDAPVVTETTTTASAGTPDPKPTS